MDGSAQDFTTIIIKCAGGSLDVGSKNWSAWSSYIQNDRRVQHIKREKKKERESFKLINQHLLMMMFNAWDIFPITVICKEIYNLRVVLTDNTAFGWQWYTCWNIFHKNFDLAKMFFTKMLDSITIKFLLQRKSKTKLLKHTSITNNCWHRCNKHLCFHFKFYRNCW